MSLLNELSIENATIRLNESLFGSQDKFILNMKSYSFNGNYVETRKFKLEFDPNVIGYIAINQKVLTISKNDDYIQNYGITNIQISNLNAIEGISFELGGQRILKSYPPYLYNIPLIEKDCVFPCVQHHRTSLVVTYTQDVEITVDIIKITEATIYKIDKLYKKVYFGSRLPDDLSYGYEVNKNTEERNGVKVDVLINSPQFIGKQELNEGMNTLKNCYNHPVNKMTLFSNVKLQSPICDIIYNFEYNYKGIVNNMHLYELEFNLPLNFSRVDSPHGNTTFNVDSDDIKNIIGNHSKPYAYLFVNALSVLSIYNGMYGLQFSK
jgi:hypothetical protein